MRPAEASAPVAKKTRKKRAKLDQFIVLDKDNKVDVVTTSDIVEFVQKKGDCKIFTIGKQVKSITIVPGKVNVLEGGEKAPDKVVVKY